MDDSIPLKCCIHCKQLLPANLQFFGSDKKSKDGWCGSCKQCKNAQIRTRRRAKKLGTLPVPPPPPPEGFKRCIKCGNLLPATHEFFYVNHRAYDELVPRCKTCYHANRPPRPAAPTPTEKQCTRCKQVKPLRSPYFSHRAGGCGWQSWCNTCRTDIRRKTPRLEPAPEGYRRCTKCKEAKPATLEFFPSYKKSRLGLGSRCRACVGFYSAMNARRWKQRNPERHKQTCREYNKTERRRTWNRLYWQNHREASRAAGRRYAAKHAEKRKRYAMDHREERRQAGRRYRQRHPERIREHCRLRRVRKLAVLGEHTPTQIAEQLKRQRYRCYYAACGHAKFEKKGGKYIYHVEHTVPLSRAAGTDIPANDMSHIVLACPSCNHQKGSRLPHEWPEGGRLL